MLSAPVEPWYPVEPPDVVALQLINIKQGILIYSIIITTMRLVLSSPISSNLGNAVAHFIARISDTCQAQWSVIFSSFKREASFCAVQCLGWCAQLSLFSCYIGYHQYTASQLTGSKMFQKTHASVFRPHNLQKIIVITQLVKLKPWGC